MCLPPLLRKSPHHPSFHCKAICQVKVTIVVKVLLQLQPSRLWTPAVLAAAAVPGAAGLSTNPTRQLHAAATLDHTSKLRKTPDKLDLLKTTLLTSIAASKSSSSRLSSIAKSKSSSSSKY
jgi:hypothetical protein